MVTSGFRVPSDLLPAARGDSDPAAAPRDQRIRELVEADACWNPALSPDGRSVAFLADGADGSASCPQVFLSPTTHWAPRQITFGPHEVVELAWSADGGLLGYAVAPGGGGGTQLHVVDRDGRSARPMFVAHNESAFAGTWTRDGRGYGFSTTLGCADSGCTAYLLDLAESTLLPLAKAEPGDGRVLVTDVSPDRRSALLRTGSRGRRRSVLVDRSVALRVPLVDSDPGTSSGSVEMARFSTDGRAVFVRSDLDREFAALGAIDLDVADEPGPLRIAAARDDADLESFSLSGDRTVGVLVWNVGGYSELEIWNPETDERRSVALIGNTGVVGGVSVDEGGRTAVFDVSGPREPPSLWHLDLATGATRRLGPPPDATSPREGLVDPTLERFVAADGRELSGWLYQPAERDGPGPTVLSFHGGPEAQERPVFSALFQALLGEGMAVFAPNVRGSTGYGRSFEDLDTGTGRFDAIGDVLAAAQHVIDTGLADPARLAVHGSSYGGYLALAGITHAPQLFAAAVDVCGIANFETFFSTTEAWMAETSKRKYGDPATEAELLHDLSPIHRMDEVRTPTLVVHGINDRNVPLRESEQVVDALRARGVPVEALFLPDEGHCLRGRPARLQVTEATVRWLRTYLNS